MRWALLLVAACGNSGSQAPTCSPGILYLDRFGGAYDHGSVDDATANLSVLVDQPRTLPPWPNGDDNWTEVTACIRTALAAFPITVTETDPGAVDHVEIVFTTTYWAGDPGTSVIVPSNCRSGHQVEFIFGDALSTSTRACQIAMLGFAEMTANLTINDNCNDLVNLAPDCSPQRAFIDTTANCVDETDEPSACRCGGTTENVFQALADRFPTCP
jgi:hypothetical protein